MGIPTFVGAGFSAQARVSGDIDGIYGGSPETYVRDLQFKCLMTALMSMSGWAGNPDKQPWTFGEPYTAINRMYLKLKAALTPYFYTLSRTAYDTGVPPVRAMALEFPSDNSTLTNNTGSAMQFMAGPFFLVAPVYRPLAQSAVRDGIYLPAGEWVDYWNGSVISGPKTIDGYPAPLEKLPLFVRGGAIIPMWPAMSYPGERLPDPLTLDVYPSGESHFDLYEDDGVTGQPTTRAYKIRFHVPKPTQEVLLHVGDANSSTLQQYQSISALDFAPSGWTFSNAIVGGIVYVKVPRLQTNSAFSVELSTGPRYPRILMLPCKNTDKQSFVLDSSGRIHLKTTPDTCLTIGSENDPASGTPAVQMHACTSATQWMFDNKTMNLHLQGDVKRCVDIDRTDRAAEMYGCASPSSVNQQFRYDLSTGAISTILDGTCMTVSPAPEAEKLVSFLV